MRIRLGILIISVVTALLGTAMLGAYLLSLQTGIEAGKEMISVYVAARAIPTGTPASELLERKLIKRARIPRKYAADKAVVSLKGTQGRVVARRLEEGEQLTASVFVSPQSGLNTPRSQVAVSVPLDEVALMNGRIKPGAHVMIMVSFKEGKDGKPVTRVLLSRALVLATDKAGGGSTGGQAAKPSITVATTPEDAEKLVFAAEEGRVWTSLWPPGAPKPPQTGGQTLDSLF